MSYIVAGIGTDVGKTVISAILCQALSADYWKPVQAGDLHNSDSDKVLRLVMNRPFKCHSEAFRLSEPMSPHAAAQIDGRKISPGKITRPDSGDKPLITELAGGLMVPFSNDFLTIDLTKKVGDPVILVANSYLGSINHTLLTLELIKQRDIPFAGIIFNGKTNPDSKDVILRYSGAHHITDIPFMPTINSSTVKQHADHIRTNTSLAGI